MTSYCKHCQRFHSAWTRLNNGYVCGCCGARERDLRIRPIKQVRVDLSANSSYTPNQRSV